MSMKTKVFPELLGFLQKDNPPDTMGTKTKPLKKWLKRTALTAGSVVALYSSTIPLTYLINRNTLLKSNTAVFSYGAIGGGIPRLADTLSAMLTDYFMYPPITLRQNLAGNRVDWYNSPTGDTFLEKVVDEQYSNVILIGHGTHECFNGTDKEIVAWEIDQRMSELGIPKKDGMLIQLTCGGGKGLSVREALLKDPSKGYSLEGTVNALDIYFRAWRDLFSSH